MLFNLDKCHILHLGNTDPCHNYNMNGHPLLDFDEEKDVGVIITSYCAPSKHVSAAALKCHSVLLQLLISFSHRDLYTFTKL